ncbi:MAG TPA: phospho-sugar mutase [Polyangiaceae bacterium]|jgi:phosphomannomutase|nr:phospho-sugar mutase [Polyangiaceae bacterium]
MVPVVPPAPSPVASPLDFAEIRTRAQRWIADDPDPATRAELHALLANPDPASTDLADRFAGALEFGTAGLRGVLGAGPNRMNRAVVARTTWGLARELLESVPGAAERGVVVGRDGRRMSRELAEDVAAILAGVGLKVVFFPSPVPTPLVGFAVKRLGAAAGVVITASHNPPEYNGYKVYWEDAAQIVPPVDARVAAAIDRAPSARVVQRPPLEVLRIKGRVIDATPDIERAYLDAVRSLAVHAEGGDRDLRIVYTPLHGVGDALVRRALEEARFTSVMTVPEQQKPDGAFPTVAFPNPEEPGAMDLALALGRKTSADLVLANDPDADRLAVATRAPGGDLRMLTGNELGVWLGHYLLTERPEAKPRAVVSSIVSSPLLGRIAADLGVRHEETLTGFKWIAQRAIALGREGFDFVFGYEEALGYCVGDVVHDKDGVSSAALAAEAAAVLRGRGLTVTDALDAIARRYGLFTSRQVSATRKGTAGLAAIRAMMDRLRASPPPSLAGDAVVAVADYERGSRRDARAGHAETETPLTLPKSNVVALELASGSRVIARPSGTEPKAKFYFDVRETVAPGEPVAAARTRAEAVLGRLVEAFLAHAWSGADGEADPGAAGP